MSHVHVEPGVRLYVDDTGGPGPPVVFLHGWPLDSRHWEYQVAALQPEGYRCVAIDNRGFGRSDHPWGHYGYDVFADDLARVVDALELDGIALVGLTLGAGTALRYMARHDGAHVARLVLCAAPGTLDTAALGELLALADGDRPALLRAAGDRFVVDELARDWLYAMGLEAMPYATRRCLEALQAGEPEADVAELTVPTLILQGLQDAFAPRALAEALQRAIPGSRLVLLERAGHGAFVSEQPGFNAALRRFVEEKER